MRVQTGDNVGIGGFIITGTAPKQVALRAYGPSLYNVPNPLADPDLELHGPAGFSTIISETPWDNGCTFGPVSHPYGSGDASTLRSPRSGLQVQPMCYFGDPPQIPWNRAFVRS